MADSILDRFFISIGWDTKGLDRGQSDIDKKTKRVRDDAKKTADDTEAQVKRIGSTVRTVRNEVAGLFLAFAGANSLKGFLTEMVNGAAAAGRAADNLGISIEKLSGVRSAARSVGGTDQDADTALGALVGAFQNYQLTGTTGHDADFQGLGLTLHDLQDPITALNKMAEAGERMTRPEFVARLQRIGIPQAVINSLEKGRKGYEELTAEGERNANLHKKDAEAAQQFDKALNDLATTIKGTIQPWLTQLIDALNVFIGDGTTITNIVIPGMIGILGAMALATAAATAPWVALAAAIGAVISAYNTWKGLSADEQANFYAQRAARWAKINEQMRNGDLMGALGTFWGGIENSAALLTGDKSGLQSTAPSGSANQGVASLYNVLAQRYGKERADGIWAGIGAESAWDPNRSNPTSGAYGLGQWLGPRKRALFAKYGRSPTAAQQIEFLISELEGGDPGGGSVLAQRTRTGTLSAYVRNFMRPGAGVAGDMQRGMQILGMPAGAQPQVGGSSTSSLTIGQVTIYTPATDAAGIAKDLHGALEKRGLVVQSNTGMTQ